MRCSLAIGVVVCLLSHFAAGLRAEDSRAVTVNKERIQSRGVAHLERVLSENVSFEFGGIPLNDAVALISSQHKVSVQLDTRALEAAGIATDSQLLRKVLGVSLHSALGLLLGDHNLTYVVRNESIVITTLDAAADTLVAQVYPVDDLVEKIGSDEILHSLQLLSKSADDEPTDTELQNREAFPNRFVFRTRLIADRALIVRTSEAHQQEVRQLLDDLRQSFDLPSKAGRR